MIHYVERCGAKIVRAGSVPCERSVPQARPGEFVELVASPSPLPAFWLDGAPHPLPPKPSPAHKFNYDTITWEPDQALAWVQVRAERDSRLTASDWVRMRADDMGEPVPLEWLEYRQALRDVTEQPDPFSIQWPVPPA